MQEMNTFKGVSHQKNGLICLGVEIAFKIYWHILNIIEER